MRWKSNISMNQYGEERMLLISGLEGTMHFLIFFFFLLEIMECPGVTL